MKYAVSRLLAVQLGADVQGRQRAARKPTGPYNWLVAECYHKQLALEYCVRMSIWVVVYQSLARCHHSSMLSTTAGGLIGLYATMLIQCEITDKESVEGWQFASSFSSLPVIRSTKGLTKHSRTELQDRRDM
jgi:hypothetical protein